MSAESFISYDLTKQRLSVVSKPAEKETPGHVIQLFDTKEAQTTILPELTTRESQLLLYTAKGFKSRVISYAMGTVRGLTFEDVFKKYNVDNSTQAVSLAIKHNVLSPEMFQNTFHFQTLDGLSQVQLDALRELTSTDKAVTNAAICERLNIENTDKLLRDTCITIGVKSRPQAAAFYLLAAKQGLIPGDTTEFLNQDIQPKPIPPLPAPRQPWRP